MVLVFVVLVLACISMCPSLAVPLLDCLSPQVACVTVPASLPLDSTSQRSTWDILWSCLATIFACTWVSVHPNLPDPREGRIRVALCRVELMLWAVIAPEMIIFWAMRQWQGARDLVQIYGEHGWTMAHGHFLQMGGFMLADGDEDISVILTDEFYDLLSNGHIAFPDISEKEIQDRSKGNGLSKGLAILQTSWFAAQCISRKIQGLAITEIELVTVAFALLNGIMYFLWWHKPVDVECCVRIYRLRGSKPRPKRIQPRRPPRGRDLPIQSITIVESPRQSMDLGSDGLKLLEDAAARSNSGPTFDGQMLPFECISNAQFFLPATTRKNTQTFRLRDVGQAFTFIFQRLKAMRGIDIDNSGEPLRTPMFFASGAINTSNVIAYDIAVSVLSTLFGLIHCLAWFFVFPSRLERFLWRSSAIVISCVPLIFLIRQGIVYLVRLLLDNSSPAANRQSNLPFILLSKFMVVLWWIFVAVIPLYVVARIALLIEAFIALRDLPVGAYSAISWTQYLPHI
ncbi:hypothetical protein GALMADRAFT_144278 [Galerina marginata CBS 339.88]|uniref:Uncharacterized protein n=1 Tax=Galerina marginata (strain CBS 339.88) TaxID=685588 RepID=A0A067SVI1_GALM3|nr:hypothetical protein GALMADRAFT_144278 [Galerina marginata CBS 339.88]